MVQTLWATTTEERKSWYLTLSALCYINPFLTYNWEETAANKWPFSCGHFCTSFLSAPSAAATQTKPVGLLDHCWLLLYESPAAPQPFPGSLKPTCSSETYPRHQARICPSPLQLLLQGIRWGLSACPSSPTCMKVPMIQLLREKPRVASQNFHSLCLLSTVKIPARFILLADELLQLLHMELSGWAIASIITGYLRNQNNCIGHSILFVIFVKMFLKYKAIKCSQWSKL